MLDKFFSWLAKDGNIMYADFIDRVGPSIRRDIAAGLTEGEQIKRRWLDDYQQGVTDVIFDATPEHQYV